MSPLLADFVAKVFFALLIKNSFGRRRDFRVKMWGTSLREDKLTGDLGDVIEATSIGGRRSDFFTARKLARTGEPKAEVTCYVCTPTYHDVPIAKS